MHKILEQVRHGLIVSCQAVESEPLYGPKHMAAMAKSAEIAGAAGIRANGKADIAAIKKTVSIPIIGIVKLQSAGSRAYITPFFRNAREIVEAGADIVALDATAVSRREPLAELIGKITCKLGVPVLADISNFDEGIRAAAYGASALATTLSGYRSYNDKFTHPDFALITRLVRSAGVPVICEGRIQTPRDLALALQAGAWAAVVGTAITRPIAITGKFMAALHMGGAKDKPAENLNYERSLNA
ncbi:MAG: N-acetylmannosamine-6-phosphate 2-epimerase [Victivallaceae bacterium]|nr:N-acetylmannosamine-6-phosphate 2-epimerase [Victivallaceae bacterium]